ncbi:MAG: hypothetical protein ACKO3A_02410 [Opitutia bacterium]
MILAADEKPFTLLGPRPALPPGWWESYWAVLVLGLAALTVLALLLATWLRRPRRVPAPFAAFEAALAAAADRPAPEATRAVTAAFRAYLAAAHPAAHPALSTEELSARLADLPLFLPARQPLLAALRAADAAKFAGATLEPAILIAALREAATRVEDARRALGGTA